MPGALPPALPRGARLWAQQHAALLRRLWLCKRRRWRQTAAEVLAPVLFAGVLCLAASLGGARDASRAAVYSNLPPWHGLVASDRYAAVTEYYTFARRHACATSQLALASDRLLPHGAGPRLAAALRWDLPAATALARAPTNRVFLSSLQFAFGVRSSEDATRLADGGALLAAAAAYLGVEMDAAAVAALDSLAAAPLNGSAWGAAADALASQLSRPPQPPGAPPGRLRRLLRAQSLNYKGALPVPSLDEFVGASLLARALLERSPEATRALRLLRGLGVAALGNLGALGGLAFAPDTPAVRAVAAELAQRHALWWPTYFAGVFADGQAAAAAAAAGGDADAPGAWAVVEFDEASAEALSYRIRMRSLLLPSTADVLQLEACGAMLCGDGYKAYLFSGFLSLMSALDAAALGALAPAANATAAGGAARTALAREADAPLWATPFPSLPVPPQSLFFTSGGALLGVVMALGLAFPLSSLARSLTQEGTGEPPLRTMLRLGGAPYGAWAATWAVVEGCVLAVGSAGAAAVLSTSLFRHAQPLLLWALLTAFAAAAMTLAFAVGAAVRRPAAAAATVPALLLAMALPRYAFGSGARAGARLAAARAACLLAPTALGFAGDALVQAERPVVRGRPPAAPGVQECVLWLLLDAAIYTGIAHGCGFRKAAALLGRLRQRWRSRARAQAAPPAEPHAASSRASRLEKLAACDDVHDDDAEGGETAPLLLTARGVCVSLHGSATLLSGAELSLRQGEVVALLGANGAGKSTLLRLLAGLDATAARVTVRGSVAARGRVALCPQAVTLSPWLTAAEHVTLFAELAGSPPSAASDALAAARLGSPRHAAALASQLSGGQQRRLQLACALAGRPDVLLLDEPCAGLDPPARRRLFASLRSVAAGRAVLLTTHYAHELRGFVHRAEVLAHGRITHCISHDNVAEGTSCLLLVAARASPAAVHVVVTAHAPGAELLRRSDDGELVWRVALSDAASGAAPPAWLPRLLGALEVDAPRLGLISCHVATEAPGDATSLLLADADALEDDDVDNSENAVDADVTAEPGAIADIRASCGSLAHGMRVVRALLRARALAVVRDPRAPLLQLLPPLLSVVLLLVVLRASTLGALGTAPLPLACATLAAAPYGSAAGGAQLATPVWWQRWQSAFAGGMAPAAWFAAAPGGGIAAACGATSVQVTSANSTLLSLELLATAMGVVDSVQGDAGGADPAVADTAAAALRFGAVVTADVELPRLSPGACVAGAGASDAAAAAAGAAAALALLGNATSSAAAGNAAVQRSFVAAAGAAVGRSVARNAQPPTNVLFNTSGPHTLPVLLAELGAAALARAGGPRGRTVASHPLPQSVEERDVLEAARFRSGAAFLLLPLAYLPATYAAHAARERASGAAAALRRSGAGAASYWVAQLLAEMALHGVASAALLGVAAAFSVDALAGSAERARGCIVLLVLYGAAATPFSFLAALLLTRPPGAAASPPPGAAAGVVAAVAAANFATGFGLTAMDVALRARRSVQRAALRARLVPICRLFPTFVLGEGIQAMLLFTAGAQADLRGGTPMPMAPGMQLFDWQALGMPLSALAVQAAGYMLLTLLAEAPERFLSRMKCAKSAPISNESDNGGDVDAGVAAERARLMADGCSGDGDVLAARGVGKSYPGRGGAAAVAGVWLGVRPGERLALLGANGAGKSTLLALLAGAVAPSYGVVASTGDGINPGVCPQHNPLLPLLSATEQLALHARLRGVPECRVRSCAADGAAAARLCDAAGRRAGALSGGAQRKLALAVARVGGPPLLLCDEPSAGLDARSRRAMWAVLSALPAATAVMLTTHSAREAAAVCTRVAVMARGRLLALGTPDELQRRYGAGHTLHATPLPGAAAALEAHLRMRAPPEAVFITAEPGGTLRVVLPPACGMLLASLAAALEGAPTRRWALSSASLAAAVDAIVERAAAADMDAEAADADLAAHTPLCSPDFSAR